ncbi:MAG: hypothetical protein KF699_10295 [Phycisphaeraceae bacterium]|nr:hypothetical protein [Phycisphaeraceae bacterium]
MSCNCGCHNDKAPATGWRKFVPLIVGAVVVVAIIAAAVLKNESPEKSVSNSPTERTTSSAKP